MDERIRELLMPVEALVFGIIMLVVYLYILQPILVDINPIFAYEGSFRSGPRSVGELMLYVTVIGSWCLYASIRLIHEFGIKEFFSGMRGLLTIIPLLILNRYIPDKYLPDRLTFDN